MVHPVRFIWPLDHPVVTRDFYYKSSLYMGGQHAAIDIVRASGDTLGRPVYAAEAGTLHVNPFDYLSGYNAYIEHADGWRSGYRHFREPSPRPLVAAVRQGDVIGYAGSTGASTGPHLHFDLWNKDRLSPEAFAKVGFWAHNPELWIDKELEEETDMTPEQAQQLADIHAWLFTPVAWGKNEKGGWYDRTMTRAEMLVTVAKYLDNGQGAIGTILKAVTE